MRFSLLLLFFVSLASFTVSSQSSLSGKITDEENGEAMAGVTLYLPDLSKGSATDVNGKFTISGIPDGWHKVQTSFVGYETKIENIYFSGQEITFDRSLHSTVTETHEVVVSGGYLSSQDENAVKIDVIGPDVIRNSGGNTLMESLAETPGINQLTTGVGIGKPIIRGLSGNRVLTVFDGFRQENQQWGSEHGLGISEQGIEKAEIIKGPASLIYGSDALGGVIHFIREKNAAEGEILGDVQMKYYDNTSGGMASLGVKGNQKGLTWNVRGSQGKHSDYRDGESRNIGNSRFSDQSISFGTGLIRNWGIISLNYDLYDQDFGLPEIETIDYARDYDFVDPYQKIRQQSLNLKSTFFLKKSKLRVNVSRQQNDRKEFEENILALFMILNTTLFDVKIEHSYNNKLEMITGTQGMFQENSNGGEELLIPDATVQNAGIYTMWKYSLDKLTLHTGLRIDGSRINSQSFSVENGERPAYDLNFSSYSAAFGSTYDISKFLLFRANVARAFRSPNLAELTSSGVHEGSNRYELGNSNLTNEQNLEIDLSAHLHSEHINMEIAAFYNFINDYIYLSPTTNYYVSTVDSVPVYAYLQNDARLYGGEFIFDFHPHPLDWLHYELTFDMVTGTDGNGDFLPLMPANSTNNELRAEFKLGKIEKTYVESGVKYFFPQNNISEIETKTDGYELLNFGAGADLKWRNQTVSISFAVKNLLNKTYISHLSRLKQYQIYDQGRSLVVSLRIPFGLKNNQ